MRLKNLQRCLLALMLCIPTIASGQSREKEARKDFARLNQSSSLLWDAGVIRRFASIQKSDILPQLLNAYLSPPTNPHKQLRYLLASAIGDHQRGPLSDRQLTGLLNFLTSTLAADGSSWGSYHGFRVLTQHSTGQKKLETIISDSKRPFIRVAALEALGPSGQGAWVNRLPTWIKRAKESRNRVDKLLSLEALAWATARVGRGWFAKGKRLKDDDMSLQQYKNREAVRLALESVIQILDDLSVFPRTKREVSLALQHCFDTDKAHEGSGAWHKLLHPDSSRSKGTTVQRIPVRFMTLSGLGTRYLFLLDASDSMLKALSDKEKAALLRILPKKKGQDGQTVERRRWKGKLTRFDGARIHLASTLRSMSDKHEFAIVLFGAQAELFTPGFVRAKETHVAKTISALMSIQAGPAKELRPDGTLKGNTNLYSGLQMAFKVGSSGVIQSAAAYVEPRLLFEGADTIFLLSDGAPTEDGFPGSSPPIKRKVRISFGGGGGGGRYDKETGKSSGKARPARPNPTTGPPVEITAPIRYENGPYLQARYLVDEIRRLNFVRRTMIHVINIGEAQDKISRAIARAGRGRFLRVGDR
jgi:hypothetical protein